MSTKTSTSTPVPTSTPLPEKSGLGEDIYSGAASFGRFWALLGAIVSTVVAIVMIGIGIYILLLPVQLSVQGTVVAINESPSGICRSISDKNGTTFNCEITVKYLFNGQEYTKDMSYSGTSTYYIGSKIPVYFKTANDPNSTSLNGQPPKWVGWALIAFAIILTLGSWFWYWATRKWKVVAAAEGTGGMLNLVSGGRW
jgi:hypothetical protein